MGSRMNSSKVHSCIDKFTANDFKFITQTLTGKTQSTSAIVSLIMDEDSRHEILDNPKLIAAISNKNNQVEISSQLYFYLIVRNSFIDAGIFDFNRCEYVAEILASFVEDKVYRQLLNHSKNFFIYSIEISEKINHLDAYSSFQLMLQTGQLYLLLTGCFEEFLIHQTERNGAPNIDYYSSLGRNYFHTAGKHPLSEEFMMEPILKDLSTHFGETRFALKEMREKYLNLDDF